MKLSCPRNLKPVDNSRSSGNRRKNGNLSGRLLLEALLRSRGYRNLVGLKRRTQWTEGNGSCTGENGFCQSLLHSLRNSRDGLPSDPCLGTHHSDLQAQQKRWKGKSGESHGPNLQGKVRNDTRTRRPPIAESWLPTRDLKKGSETLLGPCLARSQKKQRTQGDRHEWGYTLRKRREDNHFDPLLWTDNESLIKSNNSRLRDKASARANTTPLSRARHTNLCLRSEGTGDLNQESTDGNDLSFRRRGRWRGKRLRKTKN